MCHKHQTNTTPKKYRLIPERRERNKYSENKIDLLVVTPHGYWLEDLL